MYWQNKIRHLQFITIYLTFQDIYSIIISKKLTFIKLYRRSGNYEKFIYTSNR